MIPFGFFQKSAVEITLPQHHNPALSF